ncbi:hypothetical protein [Aggregatibacter actinomycetemcomitans]|uniref:hypothetical protein n=1 Tax=Aggregatibacter actinomycetemcomitans TaxID=714 RepID=UPI00215176D3|nr:hypothetical protein [Aggregatibacter actinomycetemcomitans]
MLQKEVCLLQRNSFLVGLTSGILRKNLCNFYRIKIDNATPILHTEFLNIRFVEDGRKDSVVKSVSTLAPSTPPFYCLLSELNEEE